MAGLEFILNWFAIYLGLPFFWGGEARGDLALRFLYMWL